MSAQDAFETLKTFFETRQSARQALSSVKEGVEIGVVIGDTVDCALFRKGSAPVVEQRPAQNPDVVFHIKPESVYVLSHQTKDEIADVGVNVFKEILAGNIQIRVPGRFTSILTNGYLDMLRKGGAPVTAFLARHGLGSVPKIVSTIKGMKR